MTTCDSSRIVARAMPFFAAIVVSIILTTTATARVTDDIPPTPGGASFTGCGVLEELFGCVLFVPDDGSDVALLSLQECFVEGDRVRVSGVYSTTCPSNCDAVIPCMTNTFIHFCCDGDANGDGTIDAGDIEAVIMDWGTNGLANGGDTDGNGIVDIDDLIAVILCWTPCG